MTNVLNLDRRGYRVHYRIGNVNYCPGCGHAHWLVGRASAECAFCETVLPLAPHRPVRNEGLKLAG